MKRLHKTLPITLNQIEYGDASDLGGTTVAARWAVWHGPTFAIRFEVSVHGRRLAVAGHGPPRRRLGTGTEAHVGGRRHLLAQRGELHGARRHGHVVGLVNGLRQAARVVVGWGTGAHGNIVLVHVLSGLTAHGYHAFVLLENTGHLPLRQGS